MENGSGQFKRRTKFCRVGKISIVCNGHSPFLMVHFDRLAVIPVCSTGRSITCMCNGHCAFGKGRKCIPAEYFTHQADILMGYKQAVVIYNDSAAFLSSVLQGI